jgi:hypothetical protein
LEPAAFSALKSGPSFVGAAHALLRAAFTIV